MQHEPGMTVSAWEAYLKEMLVAAWTERSPVDVTDFFYQIEANIYFYRIAEQLAMSPEKTVFYKQKIKLHAARFCEALLELSDDGKKITDHYIAGAKNRMLLINPCPSFEI